MKISRSPSRLIGGAAVAISLCAAWTVLAFQPPAPNSAPGTAPAGQPQSTPPPGGRPPEGRGPGEGRGEGRRGELPSVDSAMKGMNRALKQLSGQITDAAKKDENLRLVNDMQRNCVIAKSQPAPADVLKKAKDDPARAKLPEAFRKNLIAAVRLLLDIEQDIADGKTDSAKNRLTELAKARDAAHETMGIEDE